ncbi:hypothetical protein DY000_02018239 [Brassica cretica]|uniref:Uncharacterized protein n=1 Tax=Brassica cretica TaxID=69181 RepID=A0ABQ7CWR0_BRACR|nr:hypothetical protein DY000_02018239 [Brassica cretica]
MQQLTYKKGFEEAVILDTCCVKRGQRRGESVWASCFSFLSLETSPRGEGNGDRVSRRGSSTKRRCLSWWLSLTADSLPLCGSPRRRRIGSLRGSPRIERWLCSTATELSDGGSPRRRRSPLTVALLAGNGAL